MNKSETLFIFGLALFSALTSFMFVYYGIGVISGAGLSQHQAIFAYVTAGYGLLGYWVVEDSEDPSPEVNAALRTARTMVDLFAEYRDAFPDRFETGEFRIGIGVHMGDASLQDGGGKLDRTYTVVGDAVLVAVALEGLAENLDLRGQVRVAVDVIRTHGPAQNDQRSVFIKCRTVPGITSEVNVTNAKS